MGRPVVLSNGELFVGLDENGLVHDFYYPYVGLENLTSARNSQHKIGIWSNNHFSWTDDGSWQVNVTSEAEALVSNITMHSSQQRLSLVTRDFVDQEHNAFIRHLKITNESDFDQEVRLFLHQMFQISRAGRADTAFYVPEGHYIFDYKGRCCLLIGGKTADGMDFDQFAIGNYGIEGKAGTFKDAEDGELSGNTVEHGGVDSVIRFVGNVKPGQDFEVYYWVAAATSQTDAERINEVLCSQPVPERLQICREVFQKWLSPALLSVSGVPKEWQENVKKSLLVIKAHCDKRGSVLASGDSSIFNYGRDYYCYCWPRDAAYAIWPLIRMGIFDEARRLFIFMRDTLHPDGYLMHKYQPDRSIGSTWHPLLHGKHKELAIQEDETAIVIFMIGEFFRFSKDKEFIIDFYDSFIRPCAEFMVRYVDKETGLPHASYDLWEQKFLTSTYSVATVIAGLNAAATLAKAVGNSVDADAWTRSATSMQEAIDGLFHPDGYFRKGFLFEDGNLHFDDTIDISSLYGPYMFAELEVDDTRIQKTLQAVEQKLLSQSPIGGVIRYEGDGYFLSKPQYKGNPWIVCTLWLAQYYVAAKQPEKARELVEWARQRQHASGALSEQFDPENGTPLGVIPLVWSHAELINTMLDVSELDDK